MDLNKGISTQIAILLVIIVAAAAGVAVWQFKPTKESVPKSAADYTTQSACKEAGYYWYEEACREEEQEEEMSRQTEGFACKDVVEVNYSKDLTHEDILYIFIDWGDPFSSGGGYGIYKPSSEKPDFWKDYSEERGQGEGNYKNNNLKTMRVGFSDDLSEGGIRKEYPAGILTIKCNSGKQIDAYLPGFTDISGEGYKTNGGEEFTSGLYIVKDGSTYFDIELTELARAAE